MKVLKKHKLTLLTFLLAVIFVIALSMGTYTVYARTVTIDGANFFYTNGDASVRAHEEQTDSTAEYYTMFHLIDDDCNVTYRYNLAYHWYQAQEADDEGVIDYSAGVEGWFNMTIGFENYTFDRYIIKFQSQQYYKTEDGVTTNYVVFVSDRANGVTVYVTDDEDMTEASLDEIENKQSFRVLNGTSVNQFTIAFTGYDKGEYSLTISDSNGSGVYEGAFKNVGNTYSKRVNSTTAGVMPLTFSAIFDEDAETSICDMVLYNLNGQSFEIDVSDVTSAEDDNGTYFTGTTIADDCPPVLCISGNLNYLEYGEEIDFDYVVIDVLASSPKSTINYYVLSKEIYEDAAASGSASYFIDNTTDDDGNSLFDKTSSDDYLLIDSENPFLTDAIIESNKSGESGYTVGCLVKVFIELTDVTSTTNNNASTIVYLDWYISSDYLAEVSVGSESSSFIMALYDEQGATYVTGDELETLTNEYQAKIDELAYDENGQVALSAGSSSNFYLPAFDGFISDNLDGYEDLSYSIYYSVDGDTDSTSSLSYNNLSISLSEAGVYRFTIYVTDSASNNMYYIDEDGELVEFTASEIYDDDVKDYLPWFTFDVVYTGASVEDPGEQTTGYVDTTYSVSSFDINGVSSYYDTAYKLYRFDRASFVADTGISLTYSEFVENLAALFESTYLTGDDGEYINTQKYFSTIKALADLNETDPDYDDFVDYAWDADDLTFVPQDENSYYLVRLTITDNYNHQAAVYGYMGIHVSAAADSYSGESDWIANNLVSVILFAVAGVALIGIIILFIIKPKDAADLDEQLAGEATSQKKSKGKNKKNK